MASSHTICRLCGYINCNGACLIIGRVPGTRNICWTRRRDITERTCAKCGHPRGAHSDRYQGSGESRA